MHVFRTISFPVRRLGNCFKRKFLIYKQYISQVVKGITSLWDLTMVDDDNSTTNASIHRSIKPDDYLYFDFLLHHMAYELIDLQVPNRKIEFVIPHGNERHNHHNLWHLDHMTRLKHRLLQQARAIFSFWILLGNMLNFLNAELQRKGCCIMSFSLSRAP